MTKKMIFQSVSDPTEVIEIELQPTGITARRPGQDTAQAVSFELQGEAKSTEKADKRGAL